MIVYYVLNVHLFVKISKHSYEINTIISPILEIGNEA